MSLVKKHTYACAPSTSRGSSSAIDISKKGDLLIYSNGENVIMRSLQDGLNVEVYTEHVHEVTCARIAPSGFYVASGDSSGKIRVWDTINPDERILKLEKELFNGPVMDIAWSPDSERIVAVGEGKESMGQCFLVNNGASVGDMDGHTAKILSCDFKPSRPFRIVSGGEDALVNFYQGPPFKLTATRRDHLKFVNCVRFSPDGSKFVTCGSDSKINLYDGKSGEFLKSLTRENGHKGSIYAVAWSPDGVSLLTVSADKTAKLWDWGQGVCTQTVSFTAKPTFLDMQVGCAWVKNVAVSLSLSGKLSFLDTTTWKPSVEISGHQKFITASTYNSATDTVYTGSWDGTVRCWKLGAGQHPVNFGDFTGREASVICMASHPELEYLVTGTRDDKVVFSEIAPEKMMFGTRQFEVSSTPTAITICKYEPHLIIVACRHALYVFRTDLETKAMIPIDGYVPQSIDVNREGTEVVVGGDDCNVHVYALNEGVLNPEEKTMLSHHRSPVTVVRYSPDQQYIASGDARKDITVWNAQSGEVAYHQFVFHSARVTSLSWSPDSRHLASGGLDSCIFVYNLDQPMRRICTRGTHDKGVTSVEFVNPELLISTGKDACLKSWNLNLE